MAEPRAKQGGVKATKKDLVLVESAAKLKTLRSLLGSAYTLGLFAEPLLDLPRTRLGVDLVGGFVPELVRTEGTQRRQRELVKEAAAAARVYLAFDPDRAGEAKASYLVDVLGDKARRIDLFALTERGVRAALESSRPIESGKVHAHHTALVLDRLVAQLASPILAALVRRGLAAERGPSLALRLVVEREREIERSPVDLALLAKGGAPLSTARLLAEASSVLRFTARKTMEVARRLYEGVAIGEGRLGLVSWPFIDAPTEGIRPSVIEPPAQIRAALVAAAGGDQEKLREAAEELALYMLIWGAHTGEPAALPPAPAEASPRHTEGTLVAALEALGVGNAATYASLVSGLEERGYATKRDARLSPTLLGTRVSDALHGCFPESLGEVLGAELEAGLGLVESGVGDGGELLARFHEVFAAELAQGKLVARAHKQRDTATDIACATCGAPMVVKWGKNGEFLACSAFPACKSSKELVRDAAGRITEKPAATTTERCPTCEEPMLVRRGRYGEFLACSAYPTCKTTRPISLGVSCPRPGCGSYLVEKRSRRGQIFYGCASYAKTRCDFVAWDRPIVERCPRCGAGFLVRKETKLGAILRCVAEGCGHSEEQRSPTT